MPVSGGQKELRARATAKNAQQELPSSPVTARICRITTCTKGDQSNGEFRDREMTDRGWIWFYSQWVGRHELFKRERRQTACSGLHSLRTRCKSPLLP